MDQNHTPPPTPPPRRTTTSSNPATASLGPFAASSSAVTRSPVRGPTSSGMLRGMSSSSPTHSSRRPLSPSLHQPPLSGRLASASGSSSGSPSSSRLLRQQIPPSPGPARGGRHRSSTHAVPLPSPVLSELASIRSVGAARATSQQHSEMRAAATLYGGRPLHQALPSWSAMYARSRLGTTPPPTGSFSGVAPPASRHPQPTPRPPPPSTGTLTPQPSRYFSFPGVATSSASQQAQPSSSVVRPPAGGIPSPAMPQQQQAKSSFTDLAPLPGGSGGIFSGFAPPASQQPEAMSSFSDLAATQPAFHGGQPQQQAWPSCAAPQIGSFSASQQLQPSTSGVPQLPGGTFSGYPSPAMGQQPEANSSFTDLPPLPSGGGIISDLPSDSGNFSDLPSGSGIAPAAASQQQQAKSSFTTLAPLPGGSFSGLTPGHGGETAATFGSSNNSWSSSLQLAAAPAAASDTTMYGHGGQPSSSDSELPPLPPTLRIPSEDAMQFSQPAANDDSTFSESEAATARMQRPPLFHVKKEPVDDIDDTQCLHEPELITVDNDDDDDDAEISALLNSFRSPNEPGSLGLLKHTSTEDMLQHHGGGVGSSSSGGGGGGPSELVGAVVEGSGQSWKAMLTPYDNQVTTGATASSIPWNCGDGYSSMWSHQLGVSDVVAPQYYQPAENNILSGFGQQQLQSSLQMVPTTLLSATDLLQLLSMPGPSIWNTTDSSGQGAAAALADIFGQMSTTGQGWPDMNVSTGHQGWPETAAVADNSQYGMFDNSGSTAWAAAVPDGMASKFDQMSIGDQGSLSIGQGCWPAVTPVAPTIDIAGGGGGGSTAWASMHWNSSSWTMENYSTTPPGPELGLCATMEQPRLTTPRPPSVAAGASHSSMSSSQRGAHGEFFSVAEIEMIIKDKRLKEMVNKDPDRVKRILNNRTSVSKLRPQRRAK